MANALLSIVVTLIVAWAWPNLPAWRRLSWLHRPARHWLDHPRTAGISLLLLVAALFIGTLLLAVLLGDGLIGFLFATLVFCLCLGPRDLEADVRGVLKAADSDQRALGVRALHEDTRCADGDDWAVLMFAAALSRWFGVVIWFIVLGPAGALGYRAVQLLARHDAFADVPAGQRADLEQAARVLDWLPERLLALSAALLSSFDRVMARWSEHRAAAGKRWWSLDDGLLAVVARAAVQADAVDPLPRDRLACALQLLRRALLSWIAVLAVLVIIS